MGKTRSHTVVAMSWSKTSKIGCFIQIECLPATPTADQPTPRPTNSIVATTDEDHPLLRREDVRSATLDRRDRDDGKEARSAVVDGRVMLQPHRE
jgi:hypothetical protein